MAAGLVTVRQVSTAASMAMPGAHASRVSTAPRNALAGPPTPAGVVHRLAADVVSGAGGRVAVGILPGALAAVTHAVRDPPATR
jgi:hypothetical protein